MKAEAQLLEGKILAQKIQEEILRKISDFRAQGLETPKLASIETRQDPSGVWYINQQEKLAKKLGIGFERFQVSGNQKIFEERLEQLGMHEKSFHGIFLEMPFPKDWDVDRLILQLNPQKDVEGVHPASLGLIVLRKARLIPSTAYAALKLIESTGVSLKGKRAAVIGQSAIVGRPLQLLLGERRVTVTVCNTGTSQEDLQKIVGESDIVVACAGTPGLVRGSWIKEGAVVIDVGTTEVEGKLVGDIEFEAAKERAQFITPVPGGVGPLTVTMLMQNLIQAYEWQKAK